MLQYCLVWRGDSLALMDATSGVFTMVRLIDFSPFGSLTIGRSLGISEIEWDIDQDILMEN